MRKLILVFSIALCLAFAAQAEWDRDWKSDHEEIVVTVSKDGDVDVQVKLEHVVQDYTYYVVSQNGKYVIKHREMEILHKQNKWGKHPGQGQAREGALLDYPKSAFSVSMRSEDEPGSVVSFMFVTEGSEGYFIRLVTMFERKKIDEGVQEL